MDRGFTTILGGYRRCMARHHLRLLLCTLAVMAIGAGTWSLFAVHDAVVVAPSAAQPAAMRAEVTTTQAPASEAIDAIGIERSPSAAARDISSAVLAATSLAGLVALTWLTSRRTSVGLHSLTILAAAPRGPPRALRT